MEPWAKRTNGKPNATPGKRANGQRAAGEEHSTHPQPQPTMRPKDSLKTNDVGTQHRSPSAAAAVDSDYEAVPDSGPRCCMRS